MTDNAVLEVSPPSAADLLAEAYHRLDYDAGGLFDAVRQPSSPSEDSSEWLEKGDWLALASDVGADKILFVNNDPVIVFFRFDRVLTAQEQTDAFRRAWCMARPQCLFLAQPGELRCYPESGEWW
jgi:hypothetical protein